MYMWVLASMYMHHLHIHSYFFQKLKDWVPYYNNNLLISGNVEIESELFQRGTTLVQMVSGV